MSMIQSMIKGERTVSRIKSARIVPPAAPSVVLVARN